MLSREVTVIVKVKADTPFRLSDKVKILEAISNLKPADQQRIIEVCQTPEALQALETHWEFLQQFKK